MAKLENNIVLYACPMLESLKSDAKIQETLFAIELIEKSYQNTKYANYAYLTVS